MTPGIKGGFEGVLLCPVLGPRRRGRALCRMIATTTCGAFLPESSLKDNFPPLTERTNASGPPLTSEQHNNSSQQRVTCELAISYQCTLNTTWLRHLMYVWCLCVSHVTMLWFSFDFNTLHIWYCFVSPGRIIQNACVN